MKKKIFIRLKWLVYSAMTLLISKKRVKAKNGDSFFIKTNTSHEFHRAVTFNEKEPEMLDWLDNLNNYGLSQFVFWDVGSNIGIYSLYTAMRYKNSLIYCFEPEANNFSALCNNIYINKLTNIRPYMIGISDKSAFNELQISVMASGAGAASVETAYKYVNSNPLFIQGIYTSSFNDLYANAKFPTPNFIKIDVDGHERQILKGSNDLFKSNDLLAVMIELEYTDNADLQSVIDYFDKFGFVVSKISDWKDYSREYTIQNFLFEKRKNG